MYSSEHFLLHFQWFPFRLDMGEFDTKTGKGEHGLLAFKKSDCSILTLFSGFQIMSALQFYIQYLLKQN